MNDELKRWAEKTEAKAAEELKKAEEAKTLAEIMLEAAKRAREGEDPRKFVLIAKSLVCRLPTWGASSKTYTLKPRRRLRPWTAKEWGSRIGEEFLVYGCKKNLKTVSSDWITFFGHNGYWTRFIANKSDMETITQLDGSPCGEWEEVGE